MSSDAAKLWYLKKINLFEHLDEEEMEDLSTITTMQDVPEHQPIYFPGDPSDTVYMLKKGRVRISRSTPDGQRITLAILEEGELFGELGLTDDQPRTTRAETLEPSFLCAASAETFRQFLQKHPDLNMNITRMIGDRRRRIESRIEDLLFLDAPQRVASVLLDLFENHAEPGEDEAPTIPFSHQDIADLTALTRPTTTQILNGFQDEEFVELGRKRVTLRNYAGLKRVGER